MTTRFTIDEQNALLADSWEVHSSTAYKNYYKIVKIQDEEFEVENCITDEPDGNDYYEWDSMWRTLKAAMHHCNK